MGGQCRGFQICCREKLLQSFQIEKYCTACHGPLMTLKKTAAQGVKYNNTWCKEETSLKLLKHCKLFSFFLMGIANWMDSHLTT